LNVDVIYKVKTFLFVIIHDTNVYIEQQYLPLLLRRACLRFWVSRLEHKLNPKQGEITQVKDPECFKNLLLQHRHFAGVQ
jgi:trehalose/maltose hydrolase-like predicted phosphorylase